jgi:hypothetical protein
MPVPLTYPGIYITEIPSGSRTIPGVATSIAAFVGRALRGPVDDPVRIFTYSDFTRIFGGLWILSGLGADRSDRARGHWGHAGRRRARPAGRQPGHLGRPVHGQGGTPGGRGRGGRGGRGDRAGVQPEDLFRRSARGLGTTALFVGPSGTGKTMAAEVIARDLGLDLVVVDLSQVLSKYIGEAEKNLRGVFDVADDGASVLLLVEADTLFGKRTEVRGSHDRYANLEVGYLLQRMERFRSLAILTTNARSALDQAFLRRLRAIVSFPYPDRSAREALWRTAFPPDTATTGLDPRLLAAVDLPGGGITAAALTAARLGAEAGAVGAHDVDTATRWELAESSRTTTPAPGRRS